jgi:RNA polymerase sigma factor (sigma-70 family)
MAASSWPRAPKTRHLARVTVSSDDRFEWFCQVHFPRLLKALTLYCGDRQLAEDLAQETLIRAFVHRRRLQDHPCPEEWLYRVAFNLANSNFRRKLIEFRAQRRLTYQTERGEFRTNHADSADVVAVRTAVAALPKRQRTALLLRYFVDLPVSTVSEMMGCAEGTVKALTNKAIGRLRQDFIQE